MIHKMLHISMDFNSLKEETVSNAREGAQSRKITSCIILKLV